MSFGANFYRQFSQIVNLFTSRRTYHCPFAEPFDGLKINIWRIVWIHHWFSSTRVNCDFTVPTTPTMCCEKFAVDGHAVDGHAANCDCVQVHLVRPHSPSLELSLGRSSPSLEMSYSGAFIGTRWYTPRFWHTEQAGKFTQKHPFTSGSLFDAFRAQGSISCQVSNCSCFPSQQSKNGSSSSW